MNWRNRSTSLFQMLGIATSLAWSNSHTASRRRCLGICGTLEIGVVTSQDAADPPLPSPPCNLPVEHSHPAQQPADLYQDPGPCPQAEPLYQRSLVILDKS